MEDFAIMLVDDEERFLSTTKKLLEKKGFEVVTATRGKQALDLLAKEKVHVVVLDVKMPEMDGIETLKKIKAKFPMVEVIMLTGNATFESAIEGMKSGAVDYLMKPVDMDNLLEKAREAFKRVSRVKEKIQEAKAQKAMHSSLSPM